MERVSTSATHSKGSRESFSITYVKIRASELEAIEAKVEAEAKQNSELWDLAARLQRREVRLEKRCTKRRRHIKKLNLQLREKDSRISELEDETAELDAHEQSTLKRENKDLRARVDHLEERRALWETRARLLTDTSTQAAWLAADSEPENVPVPDNPKESLPWRSRGDIVGYFEEVNARDLEAKNLERRGEETEPDPSPSAGLWEARARSVAGVRTIREWASYVSPPTDLAAEVWETRAKSVAGVNTIRQWAIDDVTDAAAYAAEPSLFGSTGEEIFGSPDDIPEETEAPLSAVVDGGSYAVMVEGKTRTVHVYGQAGDSVFFRVGSSLTGHCWSPKKFETSRRAAIAERGEPEEPLSAVEVGWAYRVYFDFFTGGGLRSVLVSTLDIDRVCFSFDTNGSTRAVSRRAFYTARRAAIAKEGVQS